MLRIAAAATTLLFLAACQPPIDEGASCKGRMTGDLVITEFLNDPDGTDTGSEWIEIFNTLGTPIELKGVKLYVKKTDGTGLKSHIIRAGTIQPRGYFVLGDVRMGALPAYVGYAYEDSLGSLANAEGIIGLSCLTTTFDEVQYSVTPKAGHARQLDGKLNADATLNDDQTKWCDATTMLAGTANFGTPGQTNTECAVVVPAGNCLDGTGQRPVSPPLPGQVFFTEVMADPAGVDTDHEWIELRSSADVDLNGMVLTVGTTNRTLTSAQCLRVNAGGYALLAQDQDAGVNGGLPPVLATFTQTLTNSGGTLSLSIEDAGIDTASYPQTGSGVAAQLDPLRLDATGNDDPMSFCFATAPYGDPDAGNFGTPGQANSTCPPPVNPGQCRDPGTMLMRPLVPPLAGELYITEVMADPRAVADTAGEWLELKANQACDLNGLQLVVGTTRRTLSSSDCISVTAGGFAVLAHNTDAGMNGGLPSVAATFTQALGNAGGTVSLTLEDAGLIDSAVYPAAAAGIAWQLNPLMLNSSANDDPMSFCRATVGYPADGGDLGTPGGANTTCPIPPNPNECVDPVSALTRPIVRPVLGELVISEFMPDPTKVNDTAGEYIELLANASFDLNGLILANEATGMSTVMSQTCLPVTAGTYALFARSADPLVNGALPQPIATYSFDLANSGVRAVTVRSGTTTLDIFNYTAVTAGASWSLRPGLTSPDDNEDAGSVCPTPSMRYGPLADGGMGDKGTPGAVNEMCP